VKLLKEHGVIEFWHSNEPNGMVEKFGDTTLGQGLRAGLLPSVMLFAFWGEAVILVTDIYNSCPHTSLHGDSPLQANQKTSRRVVFPPILMWYSSILWQRFGGAPQAGAAWRKWHVFRYRQAFW